MFVLKDPLFAHEKLENFMKQLAYNLICKATFRPLLLAILIMATRCAGIYSKLSLLWQLQFLCYNKFLNRPKSQYENKASGTEQLHSLHQGSRREYLSGGGQKFDNILNLPHYAWMTDKIVRPKELLIPPKNSPLYLKL